LAVQKRVADDIAEQIRIELTCGNGRGLQNLKAVNPEAYEDIEEFTDHLACS
jgi:hypothetical protein